MVSEGSDVHAWELLVCFFSSCIRFFVLVEAKVHDNMGTNKYTAVFSHFSTLYPLTPFVFVAILVVGVSSLEEGVVTAGDQYTLQCDISRMAPIPNNTVLEVMWLDN